VADRLDQLAHELSPSGPVGLAVGGDHALVDAPGRFDLDVFLGLEQVVQALRLLVGKQVGSGVQGPPRGVERVVLAATVAAAVLLDAAAALVQRVAGQADHVEGVHDRDGVGELFGGRGLEAGEAVHGDHLNRVAPRLGALGQPCLEGLFRAALDHVQQSGWAGALADAGQVDDDGDVLVAPAGVSPHVLIHADDFHAVEPGDLVDEDALALGQDRVVGGVPRRWRCSTRPRDLRRRGARSGAGTRLVACGVGPQTVIGCSAWRAHWAIAAQERAPARIAPTARNRTDCRL
jgi:hypothetical protein